MLILTFVCVCVCVLCSCVFFKFDFFLTSSDLRWHPVTFNDFLVSENHSIYWSGISYYYSGQNMVLGNIFQNLPLFDLPWPPLALRDVFMYATYSRCRCFLVFAYNCNPARLLIMCWIQLWMLQVFPNVKIWKWE